MAALILADALNRAKAVEPIDPLAKSNGPTHRAIQCLKAIRLSPAFVAGQALSNITVALSRQQVCERRRIRAAASNPNHPEVTEDG